MHTGGIKRILSILNAQETGALFICLRPELCHFQKLASALESAVFFSVIHNVLCNHLTDSGNIFQERRRCGIQIYADLIDAVFDNAAECLTQLLLIHIMLILTDPD